VTEPESSGGSIDPREVEYYDRFARLWWDVGGPFWPLHRLNEVRVDYVRDHICAHFCHNADEDAPLAGLDILDVGSGGGILAESMARLGARVHGIDVVRRNIAVAADHARSSGLEIRYELTTAEALVETGARYDVVLNMEVVEHVADLPGFIDASCRLVRPAGMMFVATINRTLLAWLIAIVGAEYVLGWMPRGTHRWQLFRKPAELRVLLERHGLRVAGMTGVAVDPFRKRLFLSPLRAVNYMLAAIRPSRSTG
jgi:2-polyprenyl-6-hydroxyphenyl methylase/3-demethylubiquinone-9 3-methyltransferase